jgi:hypothetical protein
VVIKLSSGMDGFYNEMQNINTNTEKQIDVEKIYNKVITTGKDINLITDIPDTYSIVVMETISDYLLKKYGKDANVMIYPINQFTKKFKQLNPSHNGKRVTEVLNSLSHLVEYVKNRNTVQKLTGTGTTDKNES